MSKYQFLIQPRESQIRACKEIARTKRRLIWGKPGTGKTKIAIDFFAVLYHAGRVKRMVIVCPSTALGVWEEQIEMNAPHIPVQFMTKEHEDDSINWNQDGIIVTNYDYFRPRKKKIKKGQVVRTASGRKSKKTWFVDKERLMRLLNYRPNVVVIDEGHKIKNPYSRSASAAHTLGQVCEYAIDLTGTPTGNKKRLDLWSQFKFLNPSILPKTWTEFKQEYAIWGGFGGFQFKQYKNEKQFDKLVKPWITVIKKKGIEQKTLIPHRIILPDKAKRIYKEMEEEMIVEVENAKKKGEKKTVIAQIALAKIAKLQQIAGGFLFDNEGEVISIHDAKVEAVRDIADDFRESGIDRFVIFARYLPEVEAVVEALSEDKWPTYKITGERSPAERKLAESLFNSSGGVAVCQIATGGVALSFKNCDYEIFYSTDYSHINFTQAQYRIDRDEVTKPCFYYMLQAKGTVDVRIFRSLRENKDVAQELENIYEEIKKSH